MLFQFLTVAAAAAFAYTFYDNTGANWFSWHPLLMIIAYGVCMSSALYFQKAKRFTKLHILLNLLGLIASGFAFYVIWSIKNANNYAHFQSYHAIIGVTVVGLQTLTFCVSFLMGVVLGQKAHWIHPIQGKLIFVLSLAALFTGYYKKVEDVTKVACFCVFLLIAFISFLPGKSFKAEYSETKTK